MQTTLDHPNVAKIIDYDSDSGWYAMHKALESLEDLVRSRAMNGRAFESGYWRSRKL